MRVEPKTRFSLRKKGVLAVCTLSAAGGFAEIALRAIASDAPRPPIVSGIEFTSDATKGSTAPFRPHPTRLFEPHPNLRGLLSTDASSLRGGLHPESHPNLLRVTVVGDSVSMGYGVHYGDSFVGLLEARLRAEFPALDVDVVNLSCVGYSTWQNRIDLVERGSKYRSDAVILAVTGFNDSSPAVLLDDRTWVESSAEDRAFEASLLGKSRLARAIRSFSKGPSRDAILRARETAAKGDGSNGTRVSREDTRENVLAMVARATESGAEPFVVLLPNQGSTRAGAEASSRLDELRSVIESRAFVLDLRRSFESVEPAPYFDDVHPSEEGHAHLEEAIANAVVPALSAARSARGESTAPGRAATVRIDDVKPRIVSALEPNSILVFGVWPRGEPRFFLGGTPLFLQEQRPDGSCLLKTPPLKHGELGLEVATRAGSARWDQLVTTRGATIEALVKGRIKATVRGPRGARVELLAGTRLDPERLPFARRREVDPDSTLEWSAHGLIGGDGTFVFETARMPEVDSDRLYLQAIVEFETGDPPFVAAYTNVASIPLK